MYFLHFFHFFVGISTIVEIAVQLLHLLYNSVQLLYNSVYLIFYSKYNNVPNYNFREYNY